MTALLFSTFAFGLLRAGGVPTAIAVPAAPVVLLLVAAAVDRRRSARRRVHSSEVLMWVDHLRWVDGRRQLAGIAGSFKSLLRVGSRSPVPEPPSAVTDPSRCFCQQTVRLYGTAGVAYVRQHLGHVSDLGPIGAVFACPTTRSCWVGIEAGLLGPGTPAVAVRLRETLEARKPDRTYGQYL